MGFPRVHLACLWDAHPPTSSRRWIRTRLVAGAAPWPSVRDRPSTPHAPVPPPLGYPDRGAHPPDARLVSDFDLCASLGNAGYPPEHWETFLTWERELLAYERRTGGEITATELLDRIHATGLRHGLSPRQAHGVLQHLWHDVEAWRRSSSEPQTSTGNGAPLD